MFLLSSSRPNSTNEDASNGRSNTPFLLGMNHSETRIYSSHKLCQSCERIFLDADLDDPKKKAPESIIQHSRPFKNRPLVAVGYAKRFAAPGR